jgi:hypothetical protein
VHQIQTLPETAESEKQRESSNSEKPELQQSPNQKQIKPSRHKSATTTSFALHFSSSLKHQNLCSRISNTGTKPKEETV